MMGENIQKFTPKPVEEILQNNNSFNKSNINYNNIQKVETNTENIDLNSYLPNKEDIKQATDILGDLVKSTAAGCVVSKAKMTAGLYDIIEHVIDGVIWTGGKVVEGVTYALGSSNNEEYNKKILSWREKEKQFVKDVIAEDVVGHIEDAVFNTQIGKKINDASYMKYDSKQANTIENTTKIGGEIAAATAATVATGGAASPTLLAVTGSIGFAEGAGMKSQEIYQRDKNTTAAKEAGIFFSGIANGASWFARGLFGSSTLQQVGNVGNIVSNVGSVENIGNVTREAFTVHKARSLGAYIFRTRNQARELQNVADVVGSVFDTLSDSIDNNDSAAKTATKVGTGLISNIAINRAIDMGSLWARDLRPYASVAELAGKNSNAVTFKKNVQSATKLLIEQFDTYIDSGFYETDLENTLIDKAFDKLKGVNNNARN